MCSTPLPARAHSPANALRPIAPSARRRHLVGAVTFGLTALLVAALPGSASDWPQIRGSARDGVSGETGLARTWPTAGPPVVFRRAIGEGFSGISVVGDRLYTMSSDAAKETVVSADAVTGATVWETPIDELFTEEFGNGPRTTPAIDATRVYTVSSRGKLVALDRATGKQLWLVDLLATFGATQPGRGYSQSPLLDGDQLLVEVGGSENRAIVAIDPASGATRWTAPANRGSYSSPIIATIAGVDQYIFAAGGGQQLVGLSRTGQPLWSFPWVGGVIAMPIFVAPNKVFASTSGDDGAVLIQVDKAADGAFSAQQVWVSRQMKNHFNSSVVVGDHVYGFDNASLKCVALATGETKWVNRGLGKGSLIAADGLLLALGDRGVLVLVEATPDAYRETGRVAALSGKTWTQPTLAHGRLYLRDQDELLSLDLSAAGSGATPAAAAAAPKGAR